MAAPEQIRPQDNIYINQVRWHLSNQWGGYDGIWELSDMHKRMSKTFPDQVPAFVEAVGVVITNDQEKNPAMVADAVYLAHTLELWDLEPQVGALKETTLYQEGFIDAWTNMQIESIKREVDQFYIMYGNQSRYVRMRMLKENPHLLPPIAFQEVIKALDLDGFTGR